MEFLILNVLTMGLLLRVFTPCKSDDAWKRWNSSMYFFSGYEDPGLRLNHISAANYCTSLGATLASVLSEQENDFVVQNVAISDYFHWVGLEYTSDTFVEGCNLCSQCIHDDGDFPSNSNACRLCQQCQYDPGWIWSDGHTVTWRNWHITQPNENMRCVKIHSGSTGKWYDAGCSDKLPFICKKTEGISTPSAREEGSTAGDHQLSCSCTCDNSQVIVPAAILSVIVLILIILLVVSFCYNVRLMRTLKGTKTDRVGGFSDMDKSVYYNTAMGQAEMTVPGTQKATHGGDGGEYEDVSGNKGTTHQENTVSNISPAEPQDSSYEAMQRQADNSNLPPAPAVYQQLGALGNK